MTIEFNAAEPTFQWAIVRDDGAIICACSSEDAAVRAMEAVGCNKTPEDHGRTQAD